MGPKTNVSNYKEMTEILSLIEKTFSVTSFNGEIIGDINSFLKKKCIIFEILKLLKEKNIGTSESKLIEFSNLADIISELIKINRIEAEEMARNFLYFMEYSNIILEDQSKKYNFFLEDTALKLINKYEEIRPKILINNLNEIGEIIYLKYPELFNDLRSCFLFGSYITFGRNRVSTIYKTLDIFALPLIEQAKKENISCSEYLKKTKLKDVITINMKDWGIIINDYGHTYSERPNKWEERSRERMYLCVYFGWATKKVINGRDSICLTTLGKNLLINYCELRDLITSDLNLSQKEVVNFLFKNEKNKRGFFLIKSLEKFKIMIGQSNLPRRNKVKLFKKHKLILGLIDNLNKLIRGSIVSFKITNPYHSTRVHQDFHSKPYFTLLKTLNVLGPCTLQELSPLILQFKDYKKKESFEELLNQIAKNRALLNQLQDMNCFALGRRWEENSNSIVTIQGTFKSYILDFAIDFELISFYNNNYEITLIGKEILNKLELEYNQISCLTEIEIKDTFLNLIKKEKIELDEIPHKFKYSLILSNNLENITFYRFNDNLFEIINLLYPHRFEPWDFEGFRWNLEKVKLAVRTLIEKKLKYTDEEIKNKVSMKTFYDSGLFNEFLHYFKGYVSIAVMQAFPEKNFKGTDFRYPQIYLELGRVFQKILKKIYIVLGYQESKDFLYDTSYSNCKHSRKCRPDFQFKIKDNFTDKWVDAKYSNFTVFASETFRYKDECKQLEIVYLIGEKDIDIPLQGVKMMSVYKYLPEIKKAKRFDIIRDLELVRREIIPENYKPTEYDRKMIEKEMENINKELEVN